MQDGAGADAVQGGIKTPPMVRKHVQEVMPKGFAGRIASLETLDEVGMQAKLKALENLEYTLQLEEEKQRKSGMLLTMYSQPE